MSAMSEVVQAIDMATGRAICGATLRQERAEGDDREPICLNGAGKGTTHPGVGKCKLHGGSTRNHSRFAEVETARRQVELWGGRRDIHPADALIELVGWKAAEVGYWRFRVSEIAEEDLTYGVTKHEDGYDGTGPKRQTTEEAKPHIALVMLRAAEQDLASYAAAALKAGAEAARVQIARQHADQLSAVLQRILSDPRVSVDPSVANSVVLDALQILGEVGS